jgi:peptidoglycan/LPS O-acetylase OafA/YrhL
MNPAPQTDTGTDGDGNGNGFDPRQAAALLDETTQQARRRLEPAQPWLLAIRAVVVLGVLGAVWLNVRGQHPYQHPTAAVVPVAIAFGILNTIVTVAVARHATAGVTGRSRQRPAEIAGLVAVWVVAYAVMVILAGNGVSDSVAYGLYPATVPLIAGGAAWAGIAGARADWHKCAVGLAVAVTGAIALSAGPAGAWAVDGVGLCVTLLGAAAAIIWQQRRRVIRQ